MSSPLVLVTGATDGIGRETARALVRRGARVIVHGRSAAKVEATCEELEQIAKGGAAAPVLGDFAKLASVRAMGAELAARAERIDVLLHNAGVFLNERVETEDGFEATFAINHLAPFVLTHALLPRLSDGAHARIVNVSSIAHARGAIDVDRLGSLDGFEPYGAYAASKLANVLFTVELARRLGSGAVTVNALHPGVVSTKLLTEGFKMRGRDSLADGARTSVMLALAPELAGVTGRYFAAEREADVAPSGRDAQLARRLYDESCRLTGVTPLPEPPGA
jgi:NAD(P)-dependent dehydrogenase (short-subunit alcohol dehydrogenase family)